MSIHPCNTFTHVDRFKQNIRVGVLIYDEYLMGKALTHPFQALEVKYDTLKPIQPLA